MFCLHCNQRFSYSGSTSSLQYHVSAKHPEKENPGYNKSILQLHLVPQAVLRQYEMKLRKTQFVHYSL